jgi:hypothetical protein
MQEDILQASQESQMPDKDVGNPVRRASQARFLLCLAKVELQPLKSICFFNFSHHDRFAIISKLLAPTSKGWFPVENQLPWQTKGIRFNRMFSDIQDIASKLRERLARQYVWITHSNYKIIKPVCLMVSRSCCVCKAKSTPNLQCGFPGKKKVLASDPWPSISKANSDKF